MSSEENKKESKEEKKEEKKDAPLKNALKITTENTKKTVLHRQSASATSVQQWTTATAIRSLVYSFLETRTYFCLSMFNSKDVACEEKLPKNFKDFDHLLAKILVNLEETENVFLNQAKEIVDRDLTLIKLRFKLKGLQDMLKEKKRDFERIDQTVECFLRLSVHIDNILTKLEKDLHAPQASLIQNAFKYCPTRMNLYDSIMKISISQRDMLQQLSNTVLSINETVQCNPSDPVEQFIRILSLHIEVLKKIEIRIGLMEEELKTVKTLRKYLSSAKKPIMCDYYYWFKS